MHSVSKITTNDTHEAILCEKGHFKVRGKTLVTLSQNKSYLGTPTNHKLLPIEISRTILSLGIWSFII